MFVQHSPKQAMGSFSGIMGTYVTQFQVIQTNLCASHLIKVRGTFLPSLLDPLLASLCNTAIVLSHALHMKISPPESPSVADLSDFSISSHVVDCKIF